MSIDDKKNYELFGGKTLSNVFQDIYKNSNSNKKQLMGLINQLKPLVKTTDSAIMIVPLIKDYMEVSVRNDEHLIKVAEIVQRLLKEKSSTDGDNFMSKDEISDLLEEASESAEDKRKEEEIKEKVDKKMEEISDELNKGLKDK